jgi:hypothetical protein
MLWQYAQRDAIWRARVGQDATRERFLTGREHGDIDLAKKNHPKTLVAGYKMDDLRLKYWRKFRRAFI